MTCRRSSRKICENVPSIAPQFESDDKTLPDLGLVGVDMMRQKPLSLKEAITLALENNKDIEVSRQNVRIAEFDLQSVRGFYEPRFTGQTFYERATVPNVSIFSRTRTTTTGSFGRKRRSYGLHSEIRNNFERDFQQQPRLVATIRFRF